MEAMFSTSVRSPQLGPIGGRIVAEVFPGLMFGDNDSMLQLDPNWTPTIVGPGFRLEPDSRSTDKHRSA